MVDMTLNQVTYFITKNTYKFIGLILSHMYITTKNVQKNFQIYGINNLITTKLKWMKINIFPKLGIIQ